MRRGTAQEQLKALLGQQLFLGRYTRSPRRLSSVSRTRLLPVWLKGHPKVVAASVGAGWRSAKAGTAGMAFQDMECLDPGLHWG